MNEEVKNSEKEEREARYAVKNYIECATRKVDRLAEELEKVVELVDQGYDWQLVSLELMCKQFSLTGIAREMENAIKIAEENCPPLENTPDKILASGRKALIKPKKPRAKKLPAKRPEMGE